MTNYKQEVKKYAPTLVFSKGEKYFPCDVFFSGKKVINNKQEYDKLDEQKKLENILCYYHINIGRDFIVYQYWLYYAHNPWKLLVVTNNHEHDLECLKVFVGKKTKKPEYIVCNRHDDKQIVKLDDGKMPEIKVELGGHGLHACTERLPWYWQGESDYEKVLDVPPLKSCERFRTEVIFEPFGIMDGNFRLVGNDYGGVGKKSAPTVPWIRREYHFPEQTLLGVHKMKLPIKSITVDQSSDNIWEAIELGVKKGTILPTQYAALRASFPVLRSENEIPSPPLNVLVKSEAYANILKQIGINSFKDLTINDPQTIHLQMTNYIKENNLKIAIPSKRDIGVLHKKVVKLSE